jgi:hypothetical protein
MVRELVKMVKLKTINCISLVISLILIFNICFSVYSIGDDNFYNISGVFQKGSSTYDKLPYVYNDSYFKDSATKYNSSLATMSLCLELSAFPNKGVSGNDYQNQSKNVKQLLTDMGFKDIEVNNDFEKKPTIDTIGIATANKKIKINDKQYTLIPIIIRGGGYEAEWSNNMLIGSDGNHNGFDSASKMAKNFIDKYINNTEGIEGNIKFWIVGYSRGGAVAGLVGKLYNDSCNLFGCTGQLQGYCKDIKIANEDIYTYTFESPMGYDSFLDNALGKYDNIHNVVNDDDIVTKIPLKEWGFSRPGVDHKLLVGQKQEEISRVKNILSQMCVNIYGENKVEYKADKFKTYGVNWFSNNISMQSNFLDEFLHMVSDNLLEKYSYGKSFYVENNVKHRRLAYVENERVVARFIGLIVESDEVFSKSLHNALEAFLAANSKAVLVGKISISNSELKEIVRNVVGNALLDYNLRQSKLGLTNKVSREEIDYLENGISNLLVSLNKVSSYRYFYIFCKNIDNIRTMHDPEICLASLINRDEKNKNLYLQKMKYISDSFVLNNKTKAA